MSIVILGDKFTFPEGNAATNRVFTYAKGFIENGVLSHVISFGNEYLQINDGTIEGIRYYNPYGQKERNKYFLVRRYLKLRKYFKTIRLIHQINKEDKIIAIIIYTNLFLTHLLAWILAKYHNSKLIIECSEHPLQHYQSSPLKKRIGQIKFFLESNLCDAVFCISRFLVEYFHEYGRINHQKLFLVPSTVDPERFSQGGEKPFPYPYVGYFGGLTFDRDKVNVLIDSFSKISLNHPNTHLILGGFCPKKDKLQIKNLISQLNLTARAHLLEYLTREEITRYIVHADILVMARANDYRSQASYPSKLTEFLATSNPVLTVNVGEISDYLTDSLNAFIVEPDDSSQMATKLEFILNNYELAKNVGIKGKALTNTIFNYNYQAKRMVEYIKSLTA